MGKHYNPTPILDAIYETHSHARILFITPEAVASISADNVAILAVLEELCTVDHIVQTDALDFPNFTTYTMCVLGSNSDTAWTTSNLADIRAVPHVPILCFDKVAAAYLEMGTATSDASAQTAITVSAYIEASVLGMGSYYKSITGLAAGSNTISISATYHTISMANANLSEVIYATDGTNVVLGFLPSIRENGVAGLDETGDELPATLAFFGAGYEAAKLNTLGLAVIYLTCHILIHAQTKPVEIAGTVQNLRKLIIGNMGGEFGNQTPVVEFIAGQNTVGTRLPVGKSLYDILLTGAGALQAASTTESLNQAAGTYDLFTGTAQAVVLEKLSIKMPTGDAGGSITSISIQTDDATPAVIISSVDGAVANLTSEAEIAYVGRVLINTGTKIQLTIAGGAHGSAYTATIVAECRAVVSGGYLA
ncbi:MAG: hypothetical protein KAY32_15365 [Candidatus Eisenbacteria sp.]|nr:hypothetical protein [Candidatus Eisenbacteria bacterium]